MGRVDQWIEQMEAGWGGTFVIRTGITKMTALEQHPSQKLDEGSGQCGMHNNNCLECKKVRCFGASNPTPRASVWSSDLRSQRRKLMESMSVLILSFPCIFTHPNFHLAPSH